MCGHIKYFNNYVPTHFTHCKIFWEGGPQALPGYQQSMAGRWKCLVIDICACLQMTPGQRLEVMEKSGRNKIRVVEHTVNWSQSDTKWKPPWTFYGSWWKKGILYFQWLHLESPPFCAFLLFTTAVTIPVLPSHAITFCHHTLFWRVYSENLFLKHNGLIYPKLKRAFPMIPFPKCHLNNAFWDIREHVFSLEFLIRNLELKGWGSWRRGGDMGTRHLCAWWRSKLYENILRVSEQWN